jgi:glycine/D-amino acid oxidase-like deaminating enzyme
VRGRQAAARRAVAATFAAPVAGEDPDAVGAALDIELAGLSRGGDRVLTRLALTILGPGAARRLPRWEHSRVPALRGAYHGLRKLTLAAAYAPAEPAPRPVPRWAAIGYPGPAAPPRPTARSAHRPAGDLSCDVVIAGSGAGGAAAAAVLAEAGLEVVVVERGGHLGDGPSASGNRLLEAVTTRDRGIGVGSGACVGGGTVVNYSSCFRTPEPVRREWAALGAEATAGDAFDAALEAVWSRLEIGTDEGVVSPRDEALRRGLDALGWHHDLVPRNTRGCDPATCGSCGWGCPLGAKRSAPLTWLADATANGARIVDRARVERIEHRDGAVTGVVTRTGNGPRLSIRARAVVCASGALHTPALLARSGLGPTTAAGLRLHPCTFVYGQMAEPIEPWSGTMQAVWSGQHGDLDGEGHGVRYTTLPLHPGTLAQGAPFSSPTDHLELMRALPRTVSIVIQARDRDGGAVRTTRGGAPVADYVLSARDAAHLREGVAGATAILEAAGAQRIYTAPAFGSVHPMASVPLAGPLLDALGRLRAAPGVAVCDASALPTAPGVNPMVTIQAVARVVAAALARDLVPG